MNSLEHSKIDIVRSALQYSWSANDMDFFVLQREVRTKVDALFSEMETSLIHAHTDARRSIHEYNGADFSLQRFEVYSANIPLGNHYHRKSRGHNELPDDGSNKLSEMFVFDEGSGVFLLQKLNSEGVAIGKLEEFSVRARDILIVYPFQAHTLFLEPGTKFRGFRPYPFDEKDTDMHPHKLERQEK